MTYRARVTEVVRADLAERVGHHPNPKVGQLIDMVAELGYHCEFLIGAAKPKSAKWRKHLFKTSEQLIQGLALLGTDGADGSIAEFIALRCMAACDEILSCTPVEGHA